MESSKKAWKGQDKKKMVVKFGGGGIGAVVLLGGALATAALASAFVARGKRRSQIPPPPENNKLSEQQDEASIGQDEKERVESNGEKADDEASDQILSSSSPKKMGKDDVIDNEESHSMEEKLPLIIEDVSNDHIKGKGNLEIDCIESEGNANGVEGVQIARIDVEKEEGVEEFCSEEKGLGVVERAEVDLSEGGGHQERVGNKIDGGQKGLVPVFESLVIEDENVDDEKKEGSFIVEIVREDEAIEESQEVQVEYVKEKCDEHGRIEVEWIGGVEESREDQVGNVEEKCDGVDDVIELEGIDEAIGESRETLVEEKCDEPSEVIGVERIGETKQSGEDQVESVEEKCDEANDGIEVELIGEAIEESQEDQVKNIEEICDESSEGIEVESIENIQGSQEDQVKYVCDEANEKIEVESIGKAIEESRENQVDEAKDGANEEVLESLRLNNENQTLVHCLVSHPKDEEAPPRNEDGFITETSNDEDYKIQDFSDETSLSDEAEESSIGTKDSSTESNSEEVWPAESLNDSPTDNYQVEENFPTSQKVATYKFGMINVNHTNSTRRRMVVATLSLLTTLSCSWFFDLSFVNLCLIVFLTMLLSEIHDY